MELSEILKSIQPCDMDEPYIFVSYSAKDSDRVWADVLKFQQMGYNVWLDEKNLDKTQSSWRSDALNAIRDMNCYLMVFYVSRNSLVSQPCYSELACTVEDYTKAVHFGPVKFVAVDVEPISDIVEFSREVYMEIRKKDIPKADKTSQAVTLNNCIEQFFNSNNEKVRVKPFDMPNRKVDYYEEITAAFPDDTKVLEHVAEPEPEPVVVAEPVVIPEPEPVVVPEPEPVVVPEPEPVAVPEPEPVVVPEPEPVVVPEPEPEVAPKPASRPTFKYQAPAKLSPAMLAEKAMSVGSQALKDNNHYGVFTPVRNLTPKQIQNALSHIALGAREQDILGMFDASLFSNGKDGIVLTKTTLYTRWARKNPVDLRSLRKVEISSKSSHLLLTYADGRTEDVFQNIYYREVKAILEVYIEENLKQ